MSLTQGLRTPTDEAGPGQGPVPSSAPDGQCGEEEPGQQGSRCPGLAPSGQTEFRNLPGIRWLEPAGLETTVQVSHLVKRLTL